MEREYYHNKLGTILDSRDILRMTRTLFTPAISYCEVDKSAPGITIYSKESSDDFQREDGIDYYHSFHVVDDKWLDVKRYTITEEVTENITLDQLNYDECNQVRLQFQQQHVAAGYQIKDLTTNPTWNALSESEVFNHVTLSLALTNSFFFSGDQAVKTFSAERRLRVRAGAEDNTISGYYDTVLDSYHFDDKPLPLNEQVHDNWTPEYYAALDNAGENMLTMTTKDRDRVISILHNLKLLTQNNPSSFFHQEE